MALTLSKTGIAQDQTINAWHVTQSVDALTGTVAYDINLSGSLELTGSVSSLNGYIGDLTGNVTGTATNATNVRISNLPTNDIDYRLTFVSPTGLPDPSGADYAQLVVDSGSDGSGIFYNPSSNTLNASIFSGSNDGSQVDFVGSASYALNAGTFKEYVTGSYNYTTIYPQGTIYTKFEDTYASSSTVDEYDLL